jgi:osmotically-inducible protein OsmY
MDDLSRGREPDLPASRFPDYPLPETLAEAEILAARIERAVSQETGGRVRDLHVEVGRRGITLRGCCSTYYTKQQAQHAAMAVPGSGQLSNQIEVA